MAENQNGILSLNRGDQLMKKYQNLIGKLAIAVAIVIAGIIISKAITYVGVEIASKISNALSTIASQINWCTERNTPMNKEQMPVLLIGIFNIVVFVCGTFLLAMNFFFSGENFNEFVTYIALIMLAVPSFYYLVLLIKNRKK